MPHMLNYFLLSPSLLNWPLSVYTRPLFVRARVFVPCQECVAATGSGICAIGWTDRATGLEGERRGEGLGQLGVSGTSSTLTANRRSRSRHATHQSVSQWIGEWSGDGDGGAGDCYLRLELLMLQIINLLCCWPYFATSPRLASHPLNGSLCLWRIYGCIYNLGQPSRVELRLLLVLHLKQHTGNRLDRERQRDNLLTGLSVSSKAAAGEWVELSWTELSLNPSWNDQIAGCILDFRTCIIGELSTTHA